MSTTRLVACQNGHDKKHRSRSDSFAMNCFFFRAPKTYVKTRTLAGRNRKKKCSYLNQNICSDSSLEHPKHMFYILGKKIFTILRRNCMFIKTWGLNRRIRKKYQLTPFFLNFDHCTLASISSNVGCIIFCLSLQLYFKNSDDLHCQICHT